MAISKEVIPVSEKMFEFCKADLFTALNKVA
jgi:hypothetical protein